MTAERSSRRRGEKLVHGDAPLLLAHILKRDATWLALHPDPVLAPGQLAGYRALLKKRRAGWPAAYLLGYRDFAGLRFTVNRSVLVPRPESEYLVERGLEILRALPRSARVLDVGTGSGCVAVSLAKLAGSRHRYEAVDVSEKALSVARKNARAHAVQIRFFRSDLLERAWGLYDLVLANLPYVPASDYKKLRPGLRFEPKLALTDGTDRFILIKRFLEQLPSRLAPGATCLLEIDPKARAAIDRFTESYLSEATCTFSKDLAGRWRYAEIIVKK